MRIRLLGRVYYISARIKVILICIAIVAVIVVGFCLINRKELPPVETASSTNTTDNMNSNATDNDVTPSVQNSASNETDINHNTIAEATPYIQLYAVHISGCVTNEGVYRVREGAIIQDIVDMAGGLSDNADTNAINLAMKATDGMRIHIPSVNDLDKTWIIDTGQLPKPTATGGGSAQAATPTNGKININSASLAELMTLSGIGESTARAIISYREANGGYVVIEDIMKVPGIKEARFTALKDFICVE